MGLAKNDTHSKAPPNPGDQLLQSIGPLLTSLDIWLYILIMAGLWLFFWAVWGGEITTSSVPAAERGLGLNPPARY